MLTRFVFSTQVRVVTSCYLDSAINGLRYQIQDAENFTTIFKTGITSVEALSSKGMMSPLYMDMNSLNTPILITLRSYLYMNEKGFYAFRLHSNNPHTEVYLIGCID